MKFLIALSVLASTTAFAEGLNNAKWVKCYDTAQGNDREVAYKLKKWHGYIRLVYPNNLEQNLRPYNGCLVSTPNAESMDYPISFCREEGQRINGLVPVNVEYGQEEETVYCDREIYNWMQPRTSEM